MRHCSYAQEPWCKHRSHLIYRDVGTLYALDVHGACCDACTTPTKHCINQAATADALTFLCLLSSFRLPALLWSKQRQLGTAVLAGPVHCTTPLGHLFLRSQSMMHQQFFGSYTDVLHEVQLPATGCPTAEFCLQLENSMQKATWAGVNATKQVLPTELLESIVRGVTPILDMEPTLVEVTALQRIVGQVMSTAALSSLLTLHNQFVTEVQPASLQQRVTVVGGEWAALFLKGGTDGVDMNGFHELLQTDTHGQYQDVCRLFELYGHPSTDRIYIFNGDYVDRGAWGVETLTLLLAWKWALPHNVYLLRGNHETNTITRVYGFYAELKAKYGPASKGLFTLIRRTFACLPLAALVESATLILHGGLFRAPPKQGKGNKRRRSGAALTLGTLDHLRKASKGGQDPDPERSLKNCIASDVMWSDPVNAPGLRTNDARGCGTVYGPDVTQAFLSANGLKLIIRSHEGPDARAVRPDDDKMPSVDSGYAVDHDGPSGKLVTLFSAPDYPMFMAEGEPRYHNKGAVLTLSAPDYATPFVQSFDAALPRPPAESYYEVPAWTDDEDNVAECSEGSQQTDSNAVAVHAATAAGPAAFTQQTASGDGAEAPGNGQLRVTTEVIVPAEALKAAAALSQGMEAPAVVAEAASGSCLVDEGAAADEVLACGLHSSNQPENTKQQQQHQQGNLLKRECSDEPGSSSTAGPLVAPTLSTAAAAAPSEVQQQQQQQQQSSGSLSKPAVDSPADLAQEQTLHISQAQQASASRDDVAADERPAKRHKPGASSMVRQLS